MFGNEVFIGSVHNSSGRGCLMIEQAPGTYMHLELQTAEDESEEPT